MTTYTVEDSDKADELKIVEITDTISVTSRITVANLKQQLAQYEYEKEKIQEGIDECVNMLNAIKDNTELVVKDIPVKDVSVIAK